MLSSEKMTAGSSCCHIGARTSGWRECMLAASASDSLRRCVLVSAAAALLLLLWRLRIHNSTNFLYTTDTAEQLSLRHTVVLYFWFICLYLRMCLFSYFVFLLYAAIYSLSCVCVMDIVVSVGGTCISLYSHCGCMHKIFVYSHGINVYSPHLSSMLCTATVLRAHAIYHQRPDYAAAARIAATNSKHWS